MAKYVFKKGTKVVARGNSAKGFYVVGMTGIVDDRRKSTDGNEYLVKFDGRAKRVWTSEVNLVAVLDKPAKPVISKGIIVKGKNAGQIIDIVESCFGFYVLSDDTKVEKQDVFTYNDGDTLYVHILDLRVLKRLGCVFTPDCLMTSNGKIFLYKKEFSMIDKSFVIKDLKSKFITLDNDAVFSAELLDMGLIELRK